MIFPKPTKRILISARSDAKFFIDENSKGLELLSTIFIETDREKWSRAFCVKQGTDQNAKFILLFFSSLEFNSVNYRILYGDHGPYFMALFPILKISKTKNTSN